MFLIAAVLSIARAQPPRNQSKEKESVAQMLDAAAQAVQSEDFAKADIFLKKIIAAAPKNVAAQSLAGIVADRKNDLPAAEKHFAAAASISPQSPETRNNYGAILIRLNRPIEAAREFAASLKANPEQSSALVNLAQIRVSENNLAAARELFEKARAIQPDSEILRALVLISLQIGEKERAAREFREYFATLNATSASHADSRQAFTLGKALLDNDLIGEAQLELEFFAEDNASDADALVLLSKVYLARKNIKAAGKLLETAIAKGATDWRIYAALADVYQTGGFIENAIPAMRLAIEKEPKNEVLRARYGLLLIDSKAAAAAIIRLSEAVREFPNSARLWLVLGMAQQIDGKSVEARNSFERVLQIEPKSVPALAYLATSLIEQANYAEAVKIYERALAVEETNAILHYLLADTLSKIPTADAKTIQKHLTRAVQLDGKLASAHLALGKLYARADNWQQAANEFEQAAKFAPDVAETQYQLGRALVRLKRANESKAAFAKYKKLSETQTAQNENDRQELVRRLANVRF